MMKLPGLVLAYLAVDAVVLAVALSIHAPAWYCFIVVIFNEFDTCRRMLKNA
jgi:hypothetical protein